MKKHDVLRGRQAGIMSHHTTMTNVTNVRVMFGCSDTLGCSDVRKLHFVDFLESRTTTLSRGVKFTTLVGVGEAHQHSVMLI